MALTVADIDRWSAHAVREVCYAAAARGQATLAVSRRLRSLAALDGWAGATAEARRHQNAVLGDDLAAHGNEALALARAAGSAADRIEQVQARLRRLQADAAALNMTIDALTDRIVPNPAVGGAAMDTVSAEQQLQPRLRAIVAEADVVDAALASAITIADGDDDPVPPVPADDRPGIREALSTPLPVDPRRFGELWLQLTPAEKDWVYRYDHDIGNHPGMPFDPPDHLGKDHYNRLHLVELDRTTSADVDRMRHSLDALMAGRHADDGAIYALQTQLAGAENHLAGYRAVAAALDSRDGPRRYLGMIDEFGHGAVSVGNPDTATRNGIYVPGTGQDLTALPGSDQRSLRMYHAALRADPGLGPDDVAVTTWMGYDRPMDLSQAAFPDPARAAASGLDDFEIGMRASHVGLPSTDTVIGHSYGSTLVGAAASGGLHLDADNVIAVGSPGMLVDSAGGLDLQPGARVYAMRADNDIIGWAGVATEWTLGADPTAPMFGATRLAADPGSAGPLGIPSVEAHSSYWDQGNRALANLGAVLAGVPPPFVQARP
jgi:hypothetical protein